MAKIDDEEKINEILTDRHNLLNGINDLMDESVESSESLLSVEEEINEELIEEKNNRQDIIDKIVEIIDYESIRKDSLTSINESLKEEKQHRYDISDAIDITSSSEEKRIETLDYVNENLKYQISHLNSLNSTLSSTTASYQNIATAANNAAQQSGNIQTPQQPTQQSGNTQTQSGGTNNAKGIIDDEEEKASKLSTTLTNIYELLKKLAVEGFEKWVEIDDKVHKVGRSIGLNGKQARAMVDDITDSYSSMAQRLGMTFAEIFKFQEEYNKNIGRAIILTNDQVETMAGLSKLVGDVAVSDMVKHMDDFGASSELATDYLTQNMARAKAHGLDAKKTSEAFANNVKLASKYNFREGVNGISKMTLLSQKLKFNMDSIANAAEKFETVEGAIGTAANLQMLGGSFANQFGNPLEAMNMAMLDMEGFTNKIVDTFSGKAIFNRETGQAEMSAIDKRFLKEAAKQLGLNYEDAWNMATQSAKIKDVERSLKPSENFTEEQKALISNKSIFKDGKHQVTYYNDNNDQVTKSVDQLTADDLKYLVDEKTTEIAMADDVHQIRQRLDEYLGKTVKETKSNKEVWEGNKEEVRIGLADFTDNFLGDMGINPKNLLDYEYGGWVQTIFSTLITGLGVYLNKGILDTLKGIGSAKPQGNNSTNGSTNNGPSGNGSTNNGPSGNGSTNNGSSGKTSTKSSRFKKLFNRNLAKRANKAVGSNTIKNLTKFGSKKIPIIGTAIAAVGGIMDASNAISSYSQKKMEIENSNLTEKEKAIAKTEAKRERNKGIGGAVGSTGGALGGAAAGAAIGTMILPGIGTLIGGALGGWLGEKGGKSVGEAVGSAVTSEEKTEEEKKQEEIKNDEVSDKNTVLLQIRDYNQLIYELLLNRYSMVSESVVNNNSSFNQNLVDNASKQLGVNNNYAYQNFDYKKLSNGYIANNVSIKGNPIRTYNEKEYDLRDPKQRRDYNIDKILDREIKGTRQQLRDSKLNLENRAAKLLYSIEPYDYKNDERYKGNDKTPKAKKIYKTDYGEFDDFNIVQNSNHQNSLISKPNTYYNSSNMLFDNVKYGKTNVISNPNTYYNSSNMLFDNILVKDSYYNSNSSVMSKPVVGTPTHIKKTVDFNSPSYKDNLPINNKLDLNVSGTIKLTTDNGKTTNLDIDKLLNNTEFVRKLTEVITNRLNKNSNGGRSEKNSVESINNSSSVKTRNQ